MKKSKTESKLLTDVELELMNILWDLGEGSVADVISRLPADRPLAYTSVSTMLRILEQKQALETRKEGRGHVYIPILKKAEHGRATVKDVVDRVFDGAPVLLVQRLLDSVSLSDDELREIRALLERTNRGGPA